MRFNDEISPLPPPEAYVFIPPALVEEAMMELKSLLNQSNPEVRLAAADTILRHARKGRIDVEPGMTLNPFS